MLRNHPFENRVVARLLDFFRGASPWQRALWSSGIVLTLQELLEASEAVRAGVLSARLVKSRPARLPDRQ